MKYYCDSMRHLVCLPYTVANLHLMAEDLGIKRCWFHPGVQCGTRAGRRKGERNHYSHYDIPKRRIAEITAKCELVSGRTILKIVKGEWDGA